MTDDPVIKAACDAARRYAQLIFYHDRKPGCRYDSRPTKAWQSFVKQISDLPNGPVYATLIVLHFRSEMKKLVKASREV